MPLKYWLILLGVLGIIALIQEFTIKKPKNKKELERMKQYSDDNMVLLYVSAGLEIMKIAGFDGVPIARDHPNSIPDHNIVLLPPGHQELRVNYYKYNFIGKSISGNGNISYKFGPGKSYRLSCSFPNNNSIRFIISEFTHQGQLLNPSLLN
ncbi:MAG: hypothetical protein ACOX3H_10290 [Saccharofermentanales bacterium]|jgi:hypothetical protein